MNPFEDLPDVSPKVMTIIMVIAVALANIVEGIVLNASVWSTIGFTVVCTSLVPLVIKYVYKDAE